MELHELSVLKKSKRKKKRVGRGPGSGHRKTACRGHKGQRSRSGGGPAPGFEGGQMPLQRRLPKRGFNNVFGKDYSVINVKDLNRFKANTDLNISTLKEAGLVKKARQGIVLLGEGEVSIPLAIKVNKASKSAIEKVEAAGGTVEII